MKKLFNSGLLLLTLVIIFTGCSKKDTYNSYFYTDRNTDSPLSLYIDGEYKGVLPVMKTKPTYDNDTLKQKALFLSLTSGKYKVEAKDAEGIVRSSGTIKVKKNRTACTGTVGGQEVGVTNDCMIVGIRD